MKRKVLCLLLATLSYVCIFLGVSSVRIASATAPTTNVLEMMEGAEFRGKVKGEGIDYSGIRFLAYVSEEYSKADNEMGMLLMPTELLGNAELTADVEGVNIAKATTFVTDTDKDGYDCFKTVLYGIPSSYYGKEISARAYVKEGNTYKYAPMEQTQVRSIAQIAWNALQTANNNDLASELNAYLAGIEIVAPTSLTIEKGKSQNLGTTVSYVGIAPKYESCNTGVAIVDEEGDVTAVGVGETTIIVKVGEVEERTSITVTANPIANSDPEGAFWSFEDGVAFPNGGEAYTEEDKTEEHFYYNNGGMEVTTNEDEGTKSLKMGYSNGLGWFGFRIATAIAIPEGKSSYKISVRMKANTEISLSSSDFNFEGEKVTGAELGDCVNSEVNLTTKWQIVTFIFHDDIASITGFQLNTNAIIDERSELFMDYFSFVYTGKTVWSFEDGEKYPDGGEKYNDSSNSFLSVADNGIGGKCLKVKSGETIVGFQKGSKEGDANNYLISDTEVTKLVMRIKGPKDLKKTRLFWFSKNDNYSKSITFSGEWEIIEVEFNKSITTSYQFAIETTSNGNIYVDYVALPSI